MTAHATTVAFQGIEAVPVDVQAQFLSGQVQFNIVGLADKAVVESRERVRAALFAVGLALPGKRLAVNLSPADLPKEGSHYDLPIALAVLSALGVLPQDFLNRYLVIGEMGLDGALGAVTGALPAAIAANARGLGLICPRACGPEAAWAGDEVDLLAPQTIIQILNHVKGTQILSRPKPGLAEDQTRLPDLKDIKGQEAAKRALEVAAAGGHHLLMVGPPGAGKSMLAQRLPSILPPMDAREMLETSMIASLAGELPDGKVTRKRPFRSPHHSASMPALVGGGLKAKPGEISLSHNGVLFLDELPEFQPRVLEALRQPLESGETQVARANYHITYPARFQLVAAMNPCKCGMAGEPGHVCAKGPRCAGDYQARLSGPLLDRLDIQIELGAVRAADLARPVPSEGSAEVAMRVAKARERQRERFARLGLPELRTNAQADGTLLDEIATPDEPGLRILHEASDAMMLSARGYHRVLRVARTLADLDGEERVGRLHVVEALSYRQKLAAFRQAA
ncbi:YifB family Mg chelatase-like AAA ATPase [Taklimakanibacter deserti]|uniref:YifB family Mg chelatase-like AAA ATPase n=1 Tax=Taklimakanibacter deserti TaxID=2267839 RepID=UPI000E648426